MNFVLTDAQFLKFQSWKAKLPRDTEDIEGRFLFSFCPINDGKVIVIVTDTVTRKDIQL